MVSDAFGLAVSCIQEMVIDSFSLNFSLKTGRKVSSMDNYSLEEANSHKQYLRLKKVHL